MGIIVQKFGGSSVSNKENLINVCSIITKEYDVGKKVVVVVSAQGKTTNKLIDEEKEITENANKREHDVLVSVGEQITIAKLCMCLEDLGYNAISLTGWQVPIITDDYHTDASIKSIGTGRIEKELDSGKIVIIAGFQGMNEYGDITTLGRGGSDTTAVAVAASLKADSCCIYTDVDGVYTDDPNRNSDAKKIEFISYDKMIEMANNGAKVLHHKCVEIAKENNVPLYVKSTFDKEGKGTFITKN